MSNLRDRTEKILLDLYKVIQIKPIQDDYTFTKQKRDRDNDALELAERQLLKLFEEEMKRRYSKEEVDKLKDIAFQEGVKFRQAVKEKV